MEFRNAHLKINRASKLVREINDLIETKPPYTYVLETNTSTGQKSTFAKINQSSLDEIVICCGDVLHNLRSALDNAYWDAVSPRVEDSKKHCAIQFPFAKDGSKVDSAIQRRLANLVSQNFCDAIKRLESHAGVGGNVILNLVHEINIIDKHKFPTPVGDFTRVSSSLIVRQVPDFPQGIVNCGFGQNRRDVVWTGKLFNRKDIGEILPPTTDLFHKNLDVPVGLEFSIREPNYRWPVIETLNKMVAEVERILEVMRNSL
jgi:hypothetical protein